MASAIANSFAIFKECFQALGRHKTILIFPVLAGAMCLAAVFVFTFLVFYIFNSLAPVPMLLVSLFLIFTCYLGLYFICIFFFSAMVIFASSLMDGTELTIMETIKKTGQNTSNIFLWSLVSATVGVILEIIDRVTARRLDFLAALLGAGWSLAVFFVIPVMIFEKKTPVGAMKESAALFKKRWPETVAGWSGIGLSFIFLGFLGLLILIGLIKILPDAIVMALFILFAIYIILLAFLYNVLNSIYVSALYNFAVTGQIKGGFSEGTIRGAVT